MSLVKRSEEFNVYLREHLDEQQLCYIHPRLLQKYQIICDIIKYHGDLICVITSMIRPEGKIPGESGVHATGRAMDVVIEPADRSNNKLYMTCHNLSRQCVGILQTIFKRRDMKPSALFHDRGTGWHIHLQEPWQPQYKDLQGKIPETESERAVYLNHDSSLQKSKVGYYELPEGFPKSKISD